MDFKEFLIANPHVGQTFYIKLQGSSIVFSTHNLQNNYVKQKIIVRCVEIIFSAVGAVVLHLLVIKTNGFSHNIIIISCLICVR